MNIVNARRATCADIPPLVALMQEFYAEAAIPLDPAWATQAFASLLEDPRRGATWLLERDGAPVGHVVLSLRFAMEFGGLLGYVDDLFVRPAARRSGAAAAGLAALIAECRRLGCRALEVEVGADNAGAQALYSRIGMRAMNDGREMLRMVFDSPPT